MDCKREETKKRKCFRGSKLKENKGLLYFIFFILLLILIPIASERLLLLIRIIDDELLLKFINCIYAFTLIPAYLKMVIENLRKDVK